MLRKKRILKAIKPYALERLQLANELYESGKISQNEYIAAIKLIYKSGGLPTGEQSFLKFVFKHPLQQSTFFEVKRYAYKGFKA